jgi:serine protease Do
MSVSKPDGSPRARRTRWRHLASPAATATVAFLVLGVSPAVAQSQGPRTVAPVAAKLVDAVVNISTSQTLKGSSGAPLPRVPKGSPFEEFFEDFFSAKRGGGRQERKVSSLGSGFVIDGKDGLIVTNVHVIDGADEIIANFADGSKLKVEKVLGRDAKTDLALLKVTPKKPLVAARFGSSASVQVGDWVMAIGNPFGLGGTVTVGIISAKARDINSGPYDDYLQTDAAINKGNSGGPLFNMSGEVVGVNTAIISPTGGSIGIGFAVPADNVVRVVDQLRQYGEVRRGWLGVNVASVSEDMATQLGIKSNVGAHVASVSDNSPAKKAGIEVDDVILRFDGQEITTVRGLPKAVAETPVGKTVDVEIIRKGQRRTIKVEVARLDDGDASSTGKPEPGSTDTRKLMGLTLSPLTDEMRKRFQLKATLKGVVIIEVDAQSAGALRDLKPGDVIVEAQDEAVNSVSEILERIEKVRKSGRRQILLRIENAKGQVRSVAMPFQ